MLMKNAKYVLTDSGGIQEETTYLKIPCLTLRENTERPITISEGTNVLCGLDEKKIFKTIKEIESGKFKKSTIPKFWDGKSAERIVKILLSKI
jgi:UDP-N-acetylglucosamine 2-epimerase (non-hydrolysing)